MTYGFKSSSPLSPATVRALWVFSAATASVSLALQLWNWARREQVDWTQFLNPLAILVLSVCVLTNQSRVWPYHVLLVVALGLIVTSLILPIVR